MGLGKKIVDIAQQAKVIQKVKEEAPVAKAVSQSSTNEKLPMSKRRNRFLQKQSQLNNQTTLLGG